MLMVGYSQMLLGVELDGTLLVETEVRSVEADVVVVEA